MKYLCHCLGLESEQIMAIGDSENDVEMIAFAGMGVAMGNAVTAVKKVADFVTKTNNDDGVAWAFRHIVNRHD